MKLDPTVYADWQIAEEAEKTLPSVDFFREKLGLLSMNITVAFGNSVVEVASAAQKAVTASVENRTGVKVSEVNVNICGIAK